MNKKYFLSALCLTVLALAPACCCKKKCPAVTKQDVKTTAELDSTVFETENTQETKQSIAKF